MINKINLANIGRYQKASLEPGSRSSIVLVYADNGRGKTTLSSVLKSLAKGKPELINERDRIEGADQPLASIQIGASEYDFVDGDWNEAAGNINVFDDAFIEENLYSGRAPGKEQLQNMHGLIMLGEERVALYRRLQECVDKHKDATDRLNRQYAVVDKICGPKNMTVEEFCNLESNDAAADTIERLNQKLEQTKHSEVIQKQEVFDSISIPSLDLGRIEEILGKGLPDIQNDSVELVKKHIGKLDGGGEAWLEDGLKHFEHILSNSKTATCPFCLEPFSAILSYQQYFSAKYKRLKKDISETIVIVERMNLDHEHERFRGEISDARQAREFWKNWVQNCPEINMNADDVVDVWKRLLDAILDLLQEKLDSPLESKSLSALPKNLTDEHAKCLKEVKELAESLMQFNKAISAFKQNNLLENVEMIKDEIKKAQCQIERYREEAKKACDEYVKIRNEVRELKKAREQAANRLTDESKKACGNIEEKINYYLATFNAAFRVREVDYTGKTVNFKANYQIEVCDRPFGLIADEGERSFKTVLSAGDRSTLSLAFFLSHVELKENPKEQIVVLDDPMTSMDEHRRRETVKQICAMSANDRVRQIIVLSHSCSFLVDILKHVCYGEGRYTKAKRERISAHEILRVNETISEIAEWDIEQASMPVVQRLRKKVKNYIERQDPEKYAEVGASLRLILESCVSNLFGEHMEFGRKDSDLPNHLKQTGDLPEKYAEEVSKIQKYSNTFHHLGKSLTTGKQNDEELLDYCKRTLSFSPQKEKPDEDS